MYKRSASLAAILCLGVLFAAPVSTQESAPPAAKTVLQNAQKKEKKPYKAIFVMFDASW